MIRIAIVAVVVSSSVACATQAGTRASPESSPVMTAQGGDAGDAGEATSASAPVVLDLGAHRPGATIEVALGTLLDVTLDGNPSTGYSWGFIDTGEGVIEDTGERSVTLSDSGRVGSGGLETRRLRAIGPGRQTVIFEYRRPWETDVAPIRTVSWTITVVP